MIGAGVFGVLAGGAALVATAGFGLILVVPMASGLVYLYHRYQYKMLCRLKKNWDFLISYFTVPNNQK